MYVLVDPSMDHIGSIGADGLEMFDRNGARMIGGFSKNLDIHMANEWFVQNGQVRGYNGDALSRLVRSSEIQWAAQMKDSGSSAVFTWPPKTVPRLGAVNGSVVRTWDHIDASTSIARNRSFQPFGLNLDYVFDESLPGAGCGAIAADGRIAVALPEKRFLVFDPVRTEVDPETNGTVPVRLVDVPLALDAYDMSIVETGYALIGERYKISNPKPYTEFEAALAKRARRITFFLREPPPRWGTDVVHLDSEGKETWHHQVPFEVLQPPIDGGNGRVYVMGMGAAAFQDGKLLFSVPSDLPMFGTAFNDGHLAVAVGQELRIVDRDSKIVQKFTTLEHEPITTPPAIGSDGSVWVGTSKGIYVAR